MTTATLAQAQNEVYRVCQRGQTINLLLATSTDKGGTALASTSLPLKAHPVRPAPFDRKVQQSISWADQVSVIAYVSRKEIDAVPVTVDQIKAKYKSFKHNGKTYEIKHVENYKSFQNSFLYVVIGGAI